MAIFVLNYFYLRSLEEIDVQNLSSFSFNHPKLAFWEKNNYKKTHTIDKHLLIFV